MASSAVTTQILNTLRDSLDSEIAEIAVGTGTSDPTKNDSDLEAQVLSKAISETRKSSQEVTHIIRLLSSEANGNDISEAGDKDSSGGLEARYAFAAIAKTSDIEVEIRTKKTVRNPN